MTRDTFDLAIDLGKLSSPELTGLALAVPGLLLIVLVAGQAALATFAVDVEGSTGLVGYVREFRLTPGAIEAELIEISCDEQDFGPFWNGLEALIKPRNHVVRQGHG